MSRFKNTIDQQKSHINTLRGAIVGIAIVAGAFFYGWKTAPDNLTVNVPPDGGMFRLKASMALDYMCINNLIAGPMTAILIMKKILSE